MKITRRDLGVIMILAGILVAFLTYQLSFTKTQTEVEALQEEQKSLKKQIEDLQPVVDNAPFYQSEMERFVKEVGEMVQEFPVTVLYEDGIMYVVELEDQLDVSVASFTVTEAASVNSVEGAGILAGHTYALAQATTNMNYEADTYEALKELLDYIYADEENKRTISSITMTFDEKSGEISGVLNLKEYAMSDGERVYTEQELPHKDPGVESIFGETKEAEENEEEK